MQCFNGAPMTTAEVVDAVRGAGAPLTYQQASRVLRLLAARGYLWAWREPDGRRCWSATDAGHAAVGHH
jgi:hypothetical protein